MDCELSVLNVMLWISGWLGTVAADETCMSPYMPKITGQEDVVYVWTLGVEVTEFANTDHTEELERLHSLAAQLVPAAAVVG